MTKLIITALSLTSICIYLFATAPAELPKQDTGFSNVDRLDVSVMFHAVNAMNSHARQIYTRDIVGAGKKVGLNFGENWKEDGIEEGPLPALFLRELAFELEKRPEPLGLYLGSSDPINPSNLFTGDTAVDYDSLVKSKKPIFSTLESYGSLAMFPDFASTPGCVTCHNEHKDSPKTDWKLNDVMGATTWTWPDDEISSDEIRQILKAEIEALGDAYQNYLNKASAFDAAPTIGSLWPSSGQFALPDKQAFVEAVLDAASPEILTLFIEAK